MEFFKKRVFWAAIMNGLLTLLLWASANIKIPEDVPVFLLPIKGTIVSTFLPNKVFWTIPVGAFLVIFNAVLMFWTSDKKKLCKKVLKQMIDERFSGERASNRVTLFKKVSGRYALYLVITKCLLRHGVAHFQIGSLLYYLKNLPNPFSGSYLVIYARCGQPHEKGSSTFFRVPNTDSEIDGWVSYIFYKMKPDFVDLPELDLQHIRQYSKITDIQDTALRDKVDLYLKKGKMQTFEKLRTLHRCSRNLWGTPLLGSDSELWAVMVFDNDLDSPFKKNPNLVNDLRTYSNFIEKILSNA